MPLFNWQEASCQRVVESVRTHGFAVNTSDPGTGKTFVALEALQRLGMKGIVWCPKTVVSSWWAAADVMGLRGVLVDVVNPERIALGKTPWFHGNQWHMPDNALLVADEVHRGASGPDSKQTNVLALTKAFHVPVLAQSATVADSPLKLRAVGFLAGLHQFNRSSFYGWCRKNGCFNSPWHSGLEFPKGRKGQECMQKLHAQLAPFMTRIRIADLADFPETAIEPMLITLPDKDTEEFKRAYAEMDDALKKLGTNPLTQTLRARQQTEHLKAPYIAELVQEDLEAGKAVVILVQFRNTLARLVEAFPFAVQLHGDQTGEERASAIEKFQRGGTNVIAGITSAGGVGVSLHDIDGTRPRVAYHTPGWSASEFRQACGRVHRAGGTKSVQHVVLAAGTIEERIYRTLISKQGCIDSLQDGDLVGQ